MCKDSITYRSFRFFMESTFEKMFNDTVTFDADRANFPKLGVENVRIVYDDGNDTLTCRSKIGDYSTVITFLNVVENPDGKRILDADGKEFYIEPPKDDRNDVVVNCTCKDFAWRFALAHQGEKGSGKAKAPPMVRNYVKKTSTPPRNPRRLEGLCKHLMNLGAYLKQEGLLKG